MGRIASTLVAEPLPRPSADPSPAPLRRGGISALIVLAGLVITLAGSQLAISAPGSYWSMVSVHFVAPKSTDNPNGLQVSLRSLPAVAGVVAKIVDGSRSPRVVKPDASLVSQGIRHGFSVQQPNRGGQWSNQYSDPYVTVQAVGSSPAEVTATMTRLLADVDASLETLERDAGAARINWIRTQLSPPTVPLYYQRGSRVRALVASLALGFGLTAACVTVVRRLPPTPRRRRMPAGTVHDPSR